MADFVAVLRKTIDGLADNTPAIRAKVYEKARATVAAKLAAINPPPPSAVAERQKRALEDAISQVEVGYSGSGEDPFDELENVFADLTRKQPAEAKAPPAVQPQPPPPVQAEVRPPIQAKAPPPVLEKAPPPVQAKAPPPIQPKAPPPVLEKAPPPFQARAPLAPEPRPPVLLEAPSEEPAPPESEADHNAWFQPAEAEDETVDAHDERHVISFDADDGGEEVPERRPAFEEPRRRRSFAPLIAAVIVLALLAGGGYAVWLNKNDFMAMLGIEGGKATVAAAPSTDNAKPQPPRAAAAKPPAAEDVQKFTQRLKSDGTETDEGPAGGAASIGEGTSVAAVTQPPAPAPAVPPAAAQPGAPAPGDAHPAAAAPQAGPGGPAPSINPGMAAAPTAPATQPATGQPAGAEGQVAVGQKAIFYEERTNVTAGSAEPGSVVWSLVQESPGDDQPAEPAIRGEATIPGKDLQLRVTIRRNADKTLPASHIIELIFLTPENFDGGGIENILRFAMKDTEEAAGSPLLGIPAKIADGFFLIALNDTKAEIATNLNLLKRQQWIDVPLVYKSGRRALFTMEKGIPGDKVFDEVIKAWESAAASAG
ncbi:hypothetical protein SAZ10_08545 [Mesorhizobium sp. BAC0120]|uniref:hypothetical protein n=1 Tax=Mesorhizobium sp. BAC0120 TaxID=3090670 RepID=UPI00298C2876|nr:hypothetical protein [Mesorhizobium sp. BAC0120]MDW6021811.1 hypothetical protein [Mesorhizobium sp. BAC0120]